MTTIAWDEVGNRIYETGVDHGVLYPYSEFAIPGALGVAWNGLIQVSVSSEGDSPSSYYFNGVKYLTLPDPTDFIGSIEAYTYPEEFEECEGRIEVSPGFTATQQMQKSFGLSYRTKIANDVDGDTHGYKIHLIYNAIATPSNRDYATQSDNPEAMTFNWTISATPVSVEGARPTAHFEIDSRDMNPEHLASLEAVLYGYLDDPRLPLPSEIFLLLSGRYIIVLEDPDPLDLPITAETGDAVYSKSDYSVYAVNEPVLSENVRKVIVVTSSTLAALPDDAYPGDIVYNEVTGDLFRLV